MRRLPNSSSVGRHKGTPQRQLPYGVSSDTQVAAESVRTIRRRRQGSIFRGEIIDLKGIRSMEKKTELRERMPDNDHPHRGEGSSLAGWASGAATLMELAFALNKPRKCSPIESSEDPISDLETLHPDLDLIDYEEITAYRFLRDALQSTGNSGGSRRDDEQKIRLPHLRGWCSKASPPFA